MTNPKFINSVRELGKAYRDERKNKTLSVSMDFSHPYAVSRTNIKKMKRLMSRLEDKSFNERDAEELSSLSARFLYFVVALRYLDGYTLIK